MQIRSCMQCPRKCGVERTSDNGSGFCGMGADPVLARAALHFWEEPCISGKNGSGAVFFTGCSLKCVFCQNYEISTEHAVGKRFTPEGLAEIFKRLEAQGAHNINLVNPTHFVLPILRALELANLSIPVVYNSGGYERMETLKLLEGAIDIYLPDLKYADNTVALRYSGAKDYVTYAQAAVLEMARQTGPAEFDENGMMRKGTIVRHLILPGNTRNSISVLEWLKQNLPQGVLVSVMAQYLPCGRAADFSEINRKITKREYEKIQNRLFELDLDGFIQERSSAKKDFIPSFCLEGLDEENSSV